MHKLKSLITNTKDLLATPLKPIGLFYRKNRELLGSITNILAILAFNIGILALFALVWLYVRPIKVADIKVPIATDQASYHPGEEISGIFFGEIYHKGEVRILREVFCKDYKNIIEPPESARHSNFYDTQSIPRKIEGLSVNIGLLPSDIPIGLNCVLQFTNVYEIQTPFGIRRIEYQYYTQNFSIVTRERRQQLDCEAAGRKDCNYFTGNLDGEPVDKSPNPQESVDSAVDTRPPQNVYYDNRSTTDYNVSGPPTTNEPAPQFKEVCTINLAGIKVNCRNERVN